MRDVFDDILAKQRGIIEPKVKKVVQLYKERDLTLAFIFLWSPVRSRRFS